MTNTARHLRLVTDADVPPAPATRGQLPFLFAANIAPPQEHRRRCVYRTTAELRRRRAAAARRLRRRKSQRHLHLSAARNTLGWSRARSSTKLRLRPDERREMAASRRSLAVLYADRPKTLGDCQAQKLGTPSNPCPWASCRHNLRLEVKLPSGHMVRPSIKENFPGLDFDEMAETCSLRVAGRGVNGPVHGDGLSLEAVGRVLNLTMERTRQIEELGLKKVRRVVVDGQRLAPPAKPAPPAEREARREAIRATALDGVVIRFRGDKEDGDAG